MSYVHFLDVFDPTGLPAGLSDREAAEQARQKQLSEPSPRLLALLTRIRRQPPGITVNVVGGKDQQPVEWVAGDPPRVVGVGAHCALWTLVMPVDEDIQALQDAVPLLQALATARGLRVYDAAREAYASRNQPAVAPTPATPERPVSGDGRRGPKNINSKPNCQIHLHRSFGFFFRRVRGKGLPIDQVAKELVADSYTEGWIRTRRVVEQVLSQFPWETLRDEVWCGVHPLLNASPEATGTQAWTLQVDPAHAPQVLRTLMPIARQLGVSVAVPYFNFFVDADTNLGEREVYPEKTVAKYDPNWNQPFDVPRTKALLYEGLTAMFAPLGFAPVGGTRHLLALDRLLDGGRGLQRVSVNRGHGVGFEVFSGLLQEAKQRVFENADFELEHSAVVNVPLFALRGHTDKSWKGEDATTCWESEELVNLTLDDTQRLIVPLVSQLKSAKGVFDWFYDPAWARLNKASFGVVKGALKDVPGTDWSQGFQAQALEALLIARVLPDEEYWPLLDEWEHLLLSADQSLFGTKRNLKFVADYRQLPRIPEGAF